MDSFVSALVKQLHCGKRGAVLKNRRVVPLEQELIYSTGQVRTPESARTFAPKCQQNRIET